MDLLLLVSLVIAFYLLYDLLVLVRLLWCHFFSPCAFAFKTDDALEPKPYKANK